METTTTKKESQIHDVNIKTTEENYFVCTDTIQVMTQKIQDKKKKSGDGGQAVDINLKEFLEWLRPYWWIKTETEKAQHICTVGACKQTPGNEAEV